MGGVWAFLQILKCKGKREKKGKEEGKGYNRTTTKKYKSI